MSGQDKSKVTDKLPRERSSVQSQEQTFIHIIEACMIIILRLLNLLRTLCEELHQLFIRKKSH
jgi:nucleotidyltransferase/DNA polymerase involved in DNA repair